MSPEPLHCAYCEFQRRLEQVNIMDPSTNIGVDPRFMQGRALLDAVSRSVWETWRGDWATIDLMPDRV